MVKASPTVLARPAWYDRNPLTRWQTYIGSNVGPHAETTRWTYTVPAGKKATVELTYLYVRRASAPTTASQISVDVKFTPSGGSAATVVRAETFTAVTTDVISITNPIAMFLGVGDVLAVTSSDASTGGTVNYILTAKITEFDA